ncbi:hypothetical protein GP691_01825 [Escherichia coli]|nr:hypothetical protein GP692_01895 [Escherichia coli]KAE9920576.1 hypothetical protein GP691_01825 [Escherichia coli]KAE9922105.1 hypothetical protein GP690_03200 [Escherichia coli]
MQLYTDREVLNMGLCSRYKSLTCNSCSMHCQIMPEESPRLQYCANSCFCMWPEESSWICPYISRHLLSLNPLLACCRRYSRGER